MPKISKPLYPPTQSLLRHLGERIKTARLRRRFSIVTVCKRAGMSRPTLTKIEKGDPAPTMGNYLQVLRVLGLEKDISLVARDDELGRKLQDEQLPMRRRAPKQTKKEAS